MPFTQKQLTVTFDLGTGTFGESGANRVTLNSPLRVSANINESGGPSFATLDLTVWGMSLSNMNQLSTLGQIVTIQKRNTVTVTAGDVDGGMATVFQGQIKDAWADFNEMPQVGFRVSAYAGALEAIKPVPPTSYNGLVDVATVMKGLAVQAGWGFTNDGVTKKLIDPYFPGTIFEQMRRCAQAAGIEWISGPPTLAIWPKGGARGKQIAIVNPETGLIGYPTYTSSGIALLVSYTPAINYGQVIEVRSSLKAASEKWQVQVISHNLDAYVENGLWQSRIIAVPQGFFAQGGVVAR